MQSGSNLRLNNDDDDDDDDTVSWCSSEKFRRKVFIHNPNVD